MSTLSSVLVLAAQVGQAVMNVIALAYKAHAAGDQATLDAAHESLIGMANAVRPAGTDPVV